MPFTSTRQQGAFFGGHIPGISKAKARQWAHETPNLKDLPDRASGEKGKATLRSKQADLRLPHFAKLAQMMGMGGSAGSMGSLSSAKGPSTSAFDAPYIDQSGRGSGDFSPPKPKKLKTPKQQAVNPRLRVVDAMKRGVG